MESTIHAHGGAVVGVPAIPAVPASAGVAASHLAVAVRLNGVGVSGAGRGMWRGQPSIGMPTASAAAMPAPAGKVRTSELDRTNTLNGTRKLDRPATKQFRTTVYEGLRPWKVPV